MPYATGRVIHDADAHIMESPNWLRDHAEAQFRADNILFLMGSVGARLMASASSS